MADPNDAGQVRAQFGAMRDFAGTVRGLGEAPTRSASDLHNVAGQWRPSNFAQSNTLMVNLATAGGHLNDWSKGLDGTLKYDSSTVQLSADRFEGVDAEGNAGFTRISDQFRVLDATGGRQLAPGVNEADDLINRTGATVPDLPARPDGPTVPVPVEGRPAQESNWIPENDGSFLGFQDTDSDNGARVSREED